VGGREGEGKRGEYNLVAITGAASLCVGDWRTRGEPLSFFFPFSSFFLFPLFFFPFSLSLSLARSLSLALSLPFFFFLFFFSYRKRRAKAFRPDIRLMHFCNVHAG